MPHPKAPINRLPKRGPGRPKLPAEVKRQPTTVRLTSEEVAKFRALGGRRWLSSALARVKVPT